MSKKVKDFEGNRIKGMFELKKDKKKKKKKINQHELDMKLEKKKEKKRIMRCNCNHIDKRTGESCIKRDENGMAVCKICGAVILGSKKDLNNEVLDNASLVMQSVVAYIRSRMNLTSEHYHKMSNALLYNEKAIDLVKKLSNTNDKKKGNKKKDKHGKKNKGYSRREIY
jgi:hypothetical protein